MQETRRRFMLAIAAVASGLAMLSGAVCAQDPTPGMPKPPEPGDPTQRDKNAAPPDPNVMKRVMTRQNEKEFRAGV